MDTLNTTLRQTDPRPTARARCDKDSFEIIEGDAARGLILLCDHASNSVPARYGRLGLDAGIFERHIAYDIGVEPITRAVARTLGVPAVLSRFSRLLIDPNRGLDDPTLIMRLSDGVTVPGNAAIDQEERAHRIRAYYRGYHDAISTVINDALETGNPPALLSIHSFTPVWKGSRRVWDITVLWQEGEQRLSDPLLAALKRDKTLNVTDNEPYCGGLAGDTLHTHGWRRGLAHALIEMRQDLIDDVAGQRAWSERLCAILPDIIADPALHRIMREGNGYERD